jgi:hypothetical protein
MTILRLTYEELAERTGRSSEAARALTRRHRWPVEHGNDGKARVLIDEREVDARVGGRPSGQRPDTPERNPDDDQALRVLADELQAVRADRDRLAQELMAACERAGRTEGEAAALRDALFDLSRRLDRAEERLALPWWKRLLA